MNNRKETEKRRHGPNADREAAERLIRDLEASFARVSAVQRCPGGPGCLLAHCRGW